jgi:hypothetical protein
MADVCQRLGEFFAKLACGLDGIEYPTLGLLLTVCELLWEQLKRFNVQQGEADSSVKARWHPLVLIEVVHQHHAEEQGSLWGAAISWLPCPATWTHSATLYIHTVKHEGGIVHAHMQQMKQHVADLN